MNTCVVATIKDWHLKLFEERKDNAFKGWLLITKPQDLTVENLQKINPRYVFFPHWSWIVPQEILNMFECVCFHSADVPFGRGGSPIQNLIIRGLKETKVSALRMVKELDAGPVYIKMPLSLEGSAQEIFERSALIISNMMEEIVEKNPVPIPQEGEPVVFKRRTGEDNILPQEGDLEQIYNHIRMLDAESYPHSYIKHGMFRLEFTQAKLKDNKVIAKVEVSIEK